MELTKLWRSLAERMACLFRWKQIYKPPSREPNSVIRNVVYKPASIKIYYRLPLAKQHVWIYIVHIRSFLSINKNVQCFTSSVITEKAEGRTIYFCSISTFFPHPTPPLPFYSPTHPPLLYHPLRARFYSLASLL